MATFYTNDPKRNVGYFTTHDPRIEQGGGGEPPATVVKDIIAMGIVAFPR